MIKVITGTKDILPVDISKWHYLEKLLRETFQLFNYKEIRTPIFEETALFARGIGEEGDGPTFQIRLEGVKLDPKGINVRLGGDPFRDTERAEEFRKGAVLGLNLP